MRTSNSTDNSSMIIEWRAVWEELESTSDRAAAIVGEAILDQSLSKLLSSYLVRNQKEVDNLLNHPGHLSSLLSKSALAYCLGLITKEQLDDLRAINTIRNRFAHRLHESSFNDQFIKEKMDRIEAYRRFLASDQANSPRKQFDAAVSMLSYSLSIESMRMEHRQETKALSISEELKPMKLFQ